MMGIDAVITISIIIVIFYLGISKLLKYRIENNNFRIIMSSIISIVLGISFYFFSFAGIIYFLTREKSRDFNKEEWIISNEDFEKRLNRYEMIDDLIDSKILLNKDSLKVKEMLGNPNFRNNKIGIWTYEAGTGGGFGFVDHFLDVNFNNNKVVKVEHRRIED